MKKKKFKTYTKNDPSEIIVLIFDYSARFFISNLWFIVCNLPFTLFFLFIEISYDTLLLMFLALLPVGMAVTALLSAMGRLLKDRYTNITKYYLKAYKINFFQSAKVWFLFVLIIFILIYDYIFCLMNESLHLLLPCIFTAGAFITAYAINGLVIITRFKMTFIMVIKTAFYYTIKKFYISFLYLLILAAAIFLIYYLPNFILLFITSVTCYSIMFFAKPMLVDIEKRSLFIGDDQHEK